MTKFSGQIEEEDNIMSDEQINMIDSLMECDELNSWEYDFVDSICEEHELSKKQNDKLKEIYRSKSCQ